MERSAAPLVKVIDAGPGAHQSKQALVVTVGCSIVQRGPGKANTAQFPAHFLNQETRRAQSLDPNQQLKCYKPAKAVLPIKVCSRVEEKIETFQVSEG